MQLKLKLVPMSLNRPRRETVAWFVRGSNPQDWLSELNCWDIPLESLELRAIPQSFGEPTPIGVIVTQRANAAARRSGTGQSFQPSIRHGQPYGCIAGRLFVPVDAGFFPDVDANDLLSMIPQDNTEFVWHPSAGLVRVEPRERLQIVELLTAPPQRQINWNCAVTGISLSSRLISVEPDAPLTADEIFKEEASDIGSRPGALDDLPPTSDEWFGGKLNDMTKPLRDALKSLKSPPKSPASKDPNTAIPPGSPGTGNSVANWASQAFGLIAAAAVLTGKGLGVAMLPLVAAGNAAGKAMSAMGVRSFVDQVARNREIDRLLNLLKRDPDQGLQFAISMGGGGEHRGTANPSNQLVGHDVGFQLGRLSGGQPIDRWDIPPAQQYLLIQQYRELAAREIRLGRHRRAAYIFAELLGDLVCAAGALESGRHFREAAIIYRDKLKRPVDAAKCLERGGLLDEAAEMYVEIRQFEKAAEIYVRLERHGEAEQLFRQCVAEFISHRDFIDAGRVLHDKLNDIDGALHALVLGWPSSPVALNCLKRIFEIQGKHARHDEARSLISKLRNDPVESRDTKLLAKGLSGVALNYPDRSVREAAEDATRIVVARLLATVDPEEANELLSSIQTLAPQDRLLSRDCKRYVRNRIRQYISEPSAKRSTTSPGIRKINSFSLSLNGTKWRIAKANSKTVHVAGFGNNSLVLQHFNWVNPQDQSQRVFWPNVRAAGEVILEPYPYGHSPVFIHPIGVGVEQLPHTPHIPQMFPAGSPSWATANTVALAYSKGGFGWRIEENYGHLQIACFSPRGEPLNSRILPFALSSFRDWNSRVSLLVIEDRVRIGISNYLLTNQGNQLFSSRLIALENWDQIKGTIKLESDIKSLIGYPNGKDSRLIALFETGGVLINDYGQSPIATDLESPRGIFLDFNCVVIAGIGEVQVYEISHARPSLIGKHDLNFVPISVTKTDKLNEFAVFGENGQIETFLIERGY